MKSIWPRFRRDLFVLLGFTVLTLLLTWPLITQLGSVYAGNNEDLWTFQWDNWWTRYALQHGYDTLFAPVQFYPGGVSLAAHSLSFYNSLLWIPLAALFGDIAAYNLTVLLTFILSGYTMFKLVEYLQGSVNQRSGIGDQETAPPITDYRSLIPALLAGLIFAFAPYHFSQSLGHVSLASVQWFPLLALFILKATRETKRRNVIWIGLTTLLITATRLQFVVLGGVVMALFVLVDWLVLRREWTRDARGRGAWTRLIVGAALGLVLSLPIVLPAAQLYTQAASPDELIADEQTWGQTDLAAYFVPMTYHPVFGSIVQPLYENFVKNRAWMPYLGYVPLLLAVWGALRAKRRALPWVVMGLFCFVMALGPFLRVNGAELTNIPLPYALIGDRFPLNILRSPDRYNLLLPLALAPLAAWGAQDVLTRWQARARSAEGNALKRVTAIGGAIIGALILFEYLGLPYPTIDPLPTSPFHARMAQDGAEYAVLDIPLDRSDTKRYLYYQTQHGKPTVQGRVARVPEAAYELFRRVPLLSAWQTDILAQRPLDLGAQLQPLADIDVRYIILHKDLAPQRAMPALRDYFTLPPVYEDDQIAVYSTAPFTQPGQALTDEIGVANSWVAVEGPDKPLRVRVRWMAAQPIEQELAYRLELIDEAGAAVISQTDWLTPSTSSWLTGTIVIGNYSLTPAQQIPIGRYRLRLSVLDDDGVLGAIDLPHRIVNVPSVTGDWIMPVTAEPRVRFGPAIELPAADVSRRGNWLSLWLHWYARTAPGRDAKYFVHLLDEQGNVVLQEDGIHQEWTRPTSTWQTNEMLSDLIELPLWSLPPGEYRIAVGLTNPDTGERLPAVDADGAALPDNRYIFTEKIQIQ